MKRPYLSCTLDLFNYSFFLVLTPQTVAKQMLLKEKVSFVKARTGAHGCQDANPWHDQALKVLSEVQQSENEWKITLYDGALRFLQFHKSLNFTAGVSRRIGVTL